METITAKSIPLTVEAIVREMNVSEDEARKIIDAVKQANLQDVFAKEE